MSTAGPGPSLGMPALDVVCVHWLSWLSLPVDPTRRATSTATIVKWAVICCLSLCQLNVYDLGTCSTQSYHTTAHVRVSDGTVVIAKYPWTKLVTARLPKLNIKNKLNMSLSSAGPRPRLLVCQLTLPALNVICVLWLSRLSLPIDQQLHEWDVM